MDRKTDALARLNVTAQMKAKLPADIREAKAAGATWPEIVTAAQMSRTQVIELAKKE